MKHKRITHPGTFVANTWPEHPNTELATTGRPAQRTFPDQPIA